MVDPCFPGSTPPAVLSYFSSAVSLCLSLIITIGNASIILTVAKDPLKKLRTPFAFFLANAAISDVAVGAIAMPVSVIFHYKEAQREINTAFVYILHLSYFISATASLASIAAMAIDRHKTLVSMRVSRRKLPLRYCVTVSILVWAVAFGFSGFYFLTGFVTLAFIYVNIAVVSTIGITLVTYFKVIRKMRCMLITPSESKENVPRVQHATLKENQVTNVFMWMLLAFLCVYLPTLICSYLLQFSLSSPCSIRHVLRDFVFLCVSAGSASNSIVCLVKMPIIRKSLCAIVKREDQSTQSSSSEDERDKSQGAFVIVKQGEMEE